eukprot:11438924-Alexandrium_andersonii.AAC.1
MPLVSGAGGTATAMSHSVFRRQPGGAVGEVAAAAVLGCAMPLHRAQSIGTCAVPRAALAERQPSRR